MSTANIVSPASAGWFSPWSMIAEIIDASMAIAGEDEVRVP